MLRLERTQKLKRVLIGAGVILAVIAVAAFFRAAGPISSDAIQQARDILLLMYCSAGGAILSFLTALVLHLLQKDTEEALRGLEQKLNQ